MVDEDVTARAVLRAAFRIHTAWGPGLFESAYLAALGYELSKAGHQVEQQVVVPVVWDDLEIKRGFRADLIVDGCVIVEVKSIDALAPVHQKQLLTYLRLSDLRLGLLLNFGAPRLKDGLQRVANGMPS